MDIYLDQSTTQDPQERRMLAAALFEAGQHSQAEIARMLGVSRQAVHKWHNAYKDGGPQALVARRQGADTLLAPEQERQLLGLLDQGPTAHGWDDQHWTLARINRLIDEHFGTCFADLSGVWRMLDRLGRPWQVPATRAAERGEQEVTAWRTRVWPRTKRSSHLVGPQ
ncbi:winged helix-turn-helix domain-containing protein [Nocardiopsis algeriensis]|uniref:winged helix-turn-helix domain-containing protein n=1 Tax=Nocardiopsis algeriensis TaxID=1478215 RepID=UPI003B432278